MPNKRLQDYLDSRRVKYVTINHSPAVTAQEIAAAAHIPGAELAKAVMVKLDGRMVMTVLPASQRVDLVRLAEITGSARAELATEEEFAHLFPGCEVGAMPPFGQLYGVPVYASEALARDHRIYFNAGTHTELIAMAFGDYVQLVEPKLLSLS